MFPTNIIRDVDDSSTAATAPTSLCGRIFVTRFSAMQCKLTLQLILFHFYFQINIAVQCLSTDFSSQKGVKVCIWNLQTYYFICANFIALFDLLNKYLSAYIHYEPSLKTDISI